jgi:hypothetical protein
LTLTSGTASGARRKSVRFPSCGAGTRRPASKLPL